MNIIDMDAVRGAEVFREPYPHILGANAVQPGAFSDLRRDYPDITKTGYLTVDDVGLRPSFRALIDELEGPELTAALSEKFGTDLHPFPRLTTIMRHCAARHGAIHTDGASKVMTVLLYLNDAWADEAGGRLRVLYDAEHFEPYAREVPPVAGTLFAFLRSDHSWHGHLPFAGERRVVQVAWLTSRSELDRKKRRNRFSQVVKRIFGG